MTTPLNDGEYLREANAQREHDLKMAEVEANKQIQLSRQAKERAYERRNWLGAFAIVLVVAALLTMLGVALSRNADDDRRKKAEVARTCIERGNIWLNDDCLIGSK